MEGILDPNMLDHDMSVGHILLLATNKRAKDHDVLYDRLPDTIKVVLCPCSIGGSPSI